jgi:hypothetical protein
MVVMFMVTNSTLEPILAAAAAASQPAWPAPTTMTSYRGNIEISIVPRETPYPLKGIVPRETYFHKDRQASSLIRIWTFSEGLLSL